jgi:hypothetical protein
MYYHVIPVQALYVLYFLTELKMGDYLPPARIASMISNDEHGIALHEAAILGEKRKVKKILKTGKLSRRSEITVIAKDFRPRPKSCQIWAGKKIGKTW